MSLAVGDLPLLLAGPVLRRVEADLVCVWMATSQPCNASLLLFDGGDVAASDTPLGDQRAEWVSDVQATLPIGPHLHVLAITLDLRTPGGNAVRTNGALLPNRTYSYDLNFFTRDDPATRHTLLTEGLLDDPLPLGYDRGELPSFLTPPTEREQLVILHGSCRELFAVPPVEDDPALDEDPFEPPGGWPTAEVTPDDPAPVFDPETDVFPSDAYPTFPKRDGMLWVDALIDQRASLPQFRFAGRPHQLFLTGDQIYADSMSAVVLPVLNHVGRVLVGDEDLGSNPVDATTVPATLENFPPGFRRGAAVRSAYFTMSGGSSHVFSFGEFIAHYLLAWSPALWEKTDLSKDGFNKALWPDLADFNPGTIPMPEDWFLQWTFSDEVERTHTDDYETLKDQLPVADSPGPDAPEREQVEWFFRQRRDWIASKYWSPELFEWYTRRFRAGLPRVRRALANVATYMIGDDHEISDDWYFSRQWRERVFTRTLGVDIIRNGLTAYTVMQAWGNDPRRFSQGREANLLQSISAFMALPVAARRVSSDAVHDLLGLPRPEPPPGSPPRPTPTFRPLVEFSYQVEGPCHRVLVVDGRTKRRFPHRLSQAGGIDYEGGNALLPDDVQPTGLPGEQSFGLFGDSPMAAALPPRPTADTKITLVVLAVPALGPEGMELALVPLQRLARLLQDVDAESWAYEPGTYEALLASLARYESVVLLSGDIHAGFTAYADYWSAPAGQPVRTARVVQLVSSGLTKDWGEYGPAFIGHTLSHEIFESATTPTQPLAERVGWGTPLKQVPVEPPTIGDIVTVPAGSVAHPTYRARLRMRAPVVPTHGWPAGTTEARDPNWAWRAFMVRDEREEFPTTPTAVSRTTPVALPADPLSGPNVGWHAAAARRMAYGRVFCFLPNVGVVTFEKDLQDQWAVRHVLAGELPPMPPMPEAGFTPVGLQPFIVHKVSLTPPAATTWLSGRPRIVGDGGWGGDDSDPAFQLLLHALPRLWERAAGFIGADGIFAGSPVVVDDIVREAVLTDAADRIGKTFRRKILRELGPFATSTDAVLDAVPQADVDARIRELGKLDLAREARAMVRPDLERLLLYHQSMPDPAASLDDILLTACSDWVREYSGRVSTIAGLLATFRAPVTKHVPVLSRLLGGLWSLWRDGTDAETWNQVTTPPWLAGLIGVPPRAARLAVGLLSELAIGVIEDHDPRPINHAPVIFSPELVLAGIGIALGAIANNRRLSFVSGWEATARVAEPGTRNTVTNAEVLARQTMSLLIHPGKHQRHVGPARKLSFTMVPAANTVEPGRLFVAWDGGFQLDEAIGKGVHARIEATGRAFLEQPWGLAKPRGAPGERLSLSFRFPTSLTPLPGLTVRLTPSVGVSFGFVGVPTAENSSFELRLALNDKEDRITFVPGDGLLRQLLPTDGISLPLDAAVTWSPYGGWRFVGIGELARGVAVPPPTGQSPATPSQRATEVVTPINQKLGPITLHERKLEVTTTAIPFFSESKIGVRVTVAVSGTLSLSIKAARLTFTGVGLVWRIPIGEDGEAVDDPIDVKLPDGVAVALNAPSISGGGFLQRIEAPDGRVTWRGGLALRFADSFELAAFGVIELGGNRPWTFLLFVTVRFTPPYPLAFGLKLTKVGGLLALNRTMAVDALRDAVLGPASGTLDMALFAERPEEQLPVVLPMIDRFFPAAPGHQVAGLLVEIEWRAETGTLFGHFRGVLLAELENIQFALYGTAQVGFPTLTQDHILRVRAGLEAVYDYRAKFVRVSLALTEALLFKRVRLTGGAALMFRWGEHDEFAFTLGGFHPSFRPYIPPGLREPARLGAAWHPNEFVDLNLQSYFALTSTSLQFGFSAHVEIGASWGGLRADADFDFLVMRKPRTLFELDLQFRVTAHLFGCDLFSAGLKGSMTGPDPWVIEGTIYWEVCGVDMSRDFGPHQWGDDLGQIGQAQEQARRVIGDAVADPAAWSIRRQTASFVRLRAGANDALDPRDQIDVRQAQLPLGIALEVYDASGLSDAGTWHLVGTGGVAKVSDLTDVFPTRRYLRKPPKEQPFRGGLSSGARFGSTAWSVPAGAVASDESLTEDRVLDSLMVPPPQPATGHPLNVGVHFAEAILVAAPTRAPERKWTRHVVALEAAS